MNRKYYLDLFYKHKEDLGMCCEADDLPLFVSILRQVARDAVESHINLQKELNKPLQENE